MQKSWLQKKLERSLAFFAGRILKKYYPDIIAITGSVGKTSAKEAIYTTLSGLHSVRRSQGNYNNEIGLPLTIIDCDSGGKNPIAWFKVFTKAIKLITRTKPFPEILVLEMAADHPGDIEYLSSLAPPRVSIITAISPVHMEFYDDIKQVAREKRILAEQTDEDGYAILNADDPEVIKFRDHTSARVLTYGFSEQADIRAESMAIQYQKREGKSSLPQATGVTYQLRFENKTVPVTLNGAVGKPAILASLAGAAIGLIYGKELTEVAKSLAHFRPPKGRLRLLEGQGETMIIDDSYNASPKAVLVALELLNTLSQDLKSQLGSPKLKKSQTIESVRFLRRIAVLGDMAELGGYSTQGHTEVGLACAGQVDLLITVGKEARTIAKAALAEGLPESKIQSFDNSDQAGSFLKNELNKHDLVLVKGSQAARMEKVVKKILAYPDQADELLVRQGAGWGS
ncbi:MAG: UDP-N-acetylmuramoyl-tripeptide--D-alanyl-D-alanine ligase [bacterium]